MVPRLAALGLAAAMAGCGSENSDAGLVLQEPPWDAVFARPAQRP